MTKCLTFGRVPYFSKKACIGRLIHAKVLSQVIMNVCTRWGQGKQMRTDAFLLPPSLPRLYSLYKACIFFPLVTQLLCSSYQVLWMPLLQEEEILASVLGKEKRTSEWGYKLGHSFQKLMWSRWWKQHCQVSLLIIQDTTKFNDNQRWQ